MAEHSRPKKNCWEFQNCGREPGGANVAEMGVCSAATDERCHGVNHGHNGGRVCWLIAGTLCEGKTQGVFANKLNSCLSCDFYNYVQQGEEDDFQDGSQILPTICKPLEIAEMYCQLSHTIQQLKQTQQELIQSQKLEAMGKVAAEIAHEINNPLTGIICFAEALFEDLARDESARDDAQLIVHEALKCRQIVRELLEFSRKNNGARSPVLINKVVQKAVSLVQKQFSFKQISFDLDFCTKKSCVHANSNQIEQVLMNLLTNARDALCGQGNITIRTTEIAKEQKILLEVEDDGCGISPEDLPKIFESHYSTKGKSGNGLGLAAVHSIIKDHEAEIKVDSVVGQGTCFRIYFPAHNRIT